MSILPGIEPEILTAAVASNETKKNKKVSLNLPDSLVALSSMRPVTVVQTLNETLSSTPSFRPLAIHQVDKIVSSALPRLSISVSNLSAKSMTISLTRQNAPLTADFKIHAPRFPKPQTEGYFLIVTTSTGDESNGELLALKRVSWFNPQNRNNNNTQNSRGPRRNNGTTARATVKFPEEFLLSSSPAGGAAMRMVDVVIVSDSYIGMEWKMVGVEIPVLSDSNGEGPSSRTVDVEARVEKE